MRKRDWLLALVAGAFLVVWLPFALAGTALILAYGFRPRKRELRRTVKNFCERQWTPTALPQVPEPSIVFGQSR